MNADLPVLLNIIHVSKFVLGLTNSTCDMSNVDYTFYQSDSLQFSVDDTRVPRAIPKYSPAMPAVPIEFTHAPDAPDQNLHFQGDFLPVTSSLLFGTSGYCADLPRCAGITSLKNTSIGAVSVDSETSLASNINPVEQAWLPSTNSAAPDNSLYENLDYDLPSQSAFSVNNVEDFNLLSIPNDIPHSIALSKFDSVGQEVQGLGSTNSSGAPGDSSTTGWVNEIEGMPDIETYLSAQMSISDAFPAEQLVPDSFATTSTISDGETGQLVLKIDKPKRYSIQT
jgi:hypothetical protein